MPEPIKKVLMRRDGISASEAQELIDRAREELEECLTFGDFETAEKLCEKYFGLEPDYLIELMP